ncbi:hypothetical protein LG204_00980 [Methylovorus menthalis]|uniref:hypothetical protein n=1 Tax=Methylovorus menthalis TaxID=1002227 RepID=UPI001E28EB03|nr:hypothetical protein [Methylovorus menthalis]MCB4809886.1 hypothetical protein [Methylovorus menthalis]
MTFAGLSWRRLAFILLIAWGAYHHWQQRAEQHGPGVIAADSPQQQRISHATSFLLNNYTITPLAEFSLQARVLSTQRYQLDRAAQLAPVDLALGWGRMSDETVLSKINISQSGRFYFWRVEQFPIPREEIESHSANMHMVPADDTIARQLSAIRVGQRVRIQGQLIEAKGVDGWTWRSSLTRTDTGNGACELVLVKSLAVE